ncbi:MAG TPA: STAS domain-containing protein [Polyangiaceae bacterium]|jgi:rsbT co-antagonist protein RsbR|nr:STAS domain-containing protein [Polyangiaceae bacterium]
MNTNESSESESEQRILESVADALLVLSNVGYGDYSTRLDLKEGDNSPLASLYAGINDMIAALGAEQEKNQQYQQELEGKLATIERQRIAIQELSTPIMEVWDGVLCVPVVGLMDTARSSEMTSALLRAVVEKSAKCAIIDITGIDVMDTRTVDHFVRMAKAVRLLGSECVLTGMNPHIAQTVVHMGLDLSNVITHRNLRDALQQYVDLLLQGSS